MVSKRYLLELLSKTEPARQQYLGGLFKNLPEEVAKEIQYVEVEKGECLFLAGDPCDTVFFVLKGCVNGTDYSKKGEAYSFMDVSKMYVVGDFELFYDCPEYCVSIRAEQDCVLLRLSSERYLQWIRHDENALFLRLGNVLDTLTYERRIDRKYLHMDCRERLTLILTTYYENGEKDPAGGYKVRKTQTELAEKVGFNVRSIQRSIASLEKEGLISVINGKIHISREQYLRLLENEDN